MKVLIVVDLQRDFVDGALGTKEAQAIVPNVCKEIKERADKDTVVIFTKDTHYEDYMDTLEGKNLPVPHCIEGTEGHTIVDEVFKAYTGRPIVIEKPTFGSRELQSTLFAMASTKGIEEVTLMGLCTGICVLSNAILAKATLPEVPVNVVADCCACVTPESHKTALEAMKLCQINII